MRMRRVLTAFVLAGASALVLPCAMLGQRGGGHAGGFSGGHVGGFSSGGFAGHSFGVPSGGFTARSFPAPRMNFMPGPASSGYSRFAQAARPYGGFTGTRSPFGQLSIPAVRRAPYPGAVSRGLTNQPYHGGYPDGHGGDRDGHSHYRSSYHSVTIYSSPYGWPYYGGWSYWPYFGNWDSGYDYTADASSPAQASDQGSDQYYAPEQQQDIGAPAYQPAMAPAAIGAASEPAVTIIYKDGHSQQIHNYAITRSSLLMMDNASAGYSPQIPLEQINLPATEQANRAAGVDFRLPVSN